MEEDDLLSESESDSDSEESEDSSPLLVSWA